MRRRRFALVAALALVACSQGDESIIDEYVSAIYTANGGVTGARAGHCLANLGDVDGVGTVDLVVGVPKDTATHDGGVFILFYQVLGDWSGYSGISSVDLGLGNGTRAQLGTCVAGVGDLDGDGVRDLAVGSQGEDEATSPWPEGALHFVQLTSAGGAKSYATFAGRAMGLGAAADRFGAAAALVGDLDGDGLGDFLVGAPGGNRTEGCLVALTGAEVQGWSGAAGAAPGPPLLCGATVAAAAATVGAAPLNRSDVDAGLFGSSVAWDGSRAAATGLAVVGAPGLGGGRGGVWLLNVTLGAGGGLQLASAPVAVDTAGLGLAEGDAFGAAVGYLESPWRAQIRESGRRGPLPSTL